MTGGVTPAVSAGSNHVGASDTWTASVIGHRVRPGPARRWAARAQPSGPSLPRIPPTSEDASSCPPLSRDRVSTSGMRPCGGSIHPTKPEKGALYSRPMPNTRREPVTAADYLLDPFAARASVPSSSSRAVISTRPWRSWVREWAWRRSWPRTRKGQASWPMGMPGSAAGCVPDDRWARRGERSARRDRRPVGPLPCAFPHGQRLASRALQGRGAFQDGSTDGRAAAEGEASGYGNGAEQSADGRAAAEGEASGYGNGAERSEDERLARATWSSSVRPRCTPTHGSHDA